MKNKILQIKAPAKINIGLKILSKRKDGFHNIKTIFYPINLCDNITLRIAERKYSNQYSVITSPAGIITEKENLCYKALISFIKEFEIKEYYEIKVIIRKNIPVGAGLGGGSSDAAAVLKGLYKYFNISKRENELKKIALSLGSDVPFFLLNKPAYAESRGEKLRILSGFEIMGSILIINPGIHISTQWAFKQIDKVRTAKSHRITNIKYEHEIKDKLEKEKVIKGLEGYKIHTNDFEEVVFKKYPALGSIKETLLKYGADYASLSGSGSSVYGIFLYDARKVKWYFKEKEYKVFLV